MEQIAEINVKGSESWFDKRCRQLIFRLFDNINSGQILIQEGSESFSFPSNAGQEKADDLVGVLTILDKSVYRDFVKGGSIGAAEAFIEGKWSTPDLTAVITIFAKAQQQLDQLEKQGAWWHKLKNALFHLRNNNSIKGSKKNILAHYDLGNELYTRFLDPEMMYSSAIYPSEKASLAEAQLHKLDTICQRLELNSDDHLLEIGTGWGGLAIYAAKNYGCKVTTTTISDAQHEYAKNRIEALGLSDKITLLKKDYRELTGSFDKLVSIEMIEAVGFKYLPSFFPPGFNRA